MTSNQPTNQPWPLWHKILFRFFFLYFIFNAEPLTWLNGIPGFNYVLEYYYVASDWMVHGFNTYFFHLRDTLVSPNGSGDTSYSWVQLVMNLSLAVLGTIIWTLIDFKKSNYEKTYYYLRTVLRYFVAMIAFIYGIIKLFALQMTFPGLYDLATPLGDFLPMRLSWMFIGYSEPYQIFSGIMEILVGLLLLNRKTVRLGALLGLGVFTNVMMLNLCYDIPVKLFSIHIVFYCCILLIPDYRSLLNFFILDKQASAVKKLYVPDFSKKMSRILRITFKLVFVAFFVGMTFFDSYSRRQEMTQIPKSMPIPRGIYDVKTFVVNKDTIPISNIDTLIWKDIIFDRESYANVNSCDTLLNKRYRRGGFNYKSDTIKKTLQCYKFTQKGDSIFLFTIKYKLKDKNTLVMKTKIRKDSVYIEALKSNRKFQLAEKQFHWLSEYNR